MSLDKHEVTMKLNGKAVKIIFDLLEQAHKCWPGGRPADQEDLQILKNGFYRAYMDCIFAMESDKK